MVAGRRMRLPHLQHQFAAQVSALADTLRLDGRMQWKNLRLWCPHSPRPGQMQDAFKMPPVSANRGAQRSHVGAGRNWRGGTRSDEGGAPAGLHDRERLRGDITADRVEHRVDVLHDSGEVLLFVIDHQIGAEALDVGMVVRAGRRDDAGTDMLSKLNGVAGDAAGAALYEDDLPALELDRVFDRDKSCQARECERGGLDVGKTAWLAAENGGLLRDLLRIGSLMPGRQHTEHIVADLEVGDAGAERRDDTGKIAAEHVREAGNGHIRTALTNLDVGSVDAGGIDIDDDLARLSLRIRQVAIAQDVETAVAIHDDGLHEHISPMRSRAPYPAACPIVNHTTASFSW